MGSKRVVVVVHDTSKEVNWAAIRGVLHNFSLKAGDELILLGVVHQFNNSTTTSAFLGTVKLRKSSIQTLFHVRFNSLRSCNVHNRAAFKEGENVGSLAPMVNSIAWIRVVIHMWHEDNLIFGSKFLLKRAFYTIQIYTKVLFSFFDISKK